MAQRQTVKFEAGSSDFDSPVNIGDVSATLTTIQLFRGLLYGAPETEAVYTLPSAVSLIKEAPKIPIAGYCKRFSVRNDSKKSVMRLEVGDGGSTSGSMTIPVSDYAAHFVLRYSSVTSGVESYQIIRE